MKGRENKKHPVVMVRAWQVLKGRDWYDWQRSCNEMLDRSPPHLTPILDLRSGLWDCGVDKSMILPCPAQVPRIYSFTPHSDRSIVSSSTAWEDADCRVDQSRA